MPLSQQQLINLSEDSEMTVFYIPRVHTKHSSRDIRTTFGGLGFGTNLSVDLAFNPSTGFNMAFIFCNNDYWAKSQNLEILKSCLLKEQCVRIFPEPETSREFWMILPSNANHVQEEAEEQMKRAFIPTIQLDVHLSPVNARDIQKTFTDAFEPDLTESITFMKHC